MASLYPQPIQNLINLFAKLPGLGVKSAERLTFYLLANHIEELKTALAGLNGQIVKCQTCGNYAVARHCPICADAQRDQTMLAVVAKPQDVAALEKSRVFNGVYHVLGGLLTPLAGITAEDLNIKQLELRIKNHKSSIREIILAFDSNIEGETTALYLKKLLSYTGVKITRLGRGLPVGADLEYADEITLRDAIKNRQSL